MGHFVLQELTDQQLEVQQQLEQLDVQIVMQEDIVMFLGKLLQQVTVPVLLVIIVRQAQKLINPQLLDAQQAQDAQLELQLQLFAELALIKTRLAKMFASLAHQDITAYQTQQTFH